MARTTLNRDKIIHHAYDLANAQGFDSLNLAALARDLGVQTPGLYKHTEGLEDIRRGVVLIALRQLHGILLTALAGRSGDVAIRSVAAAYRRFAHDTPGAFDATAVAPPQDDKEWHEAGWQVVNAVACVFTSYDLSRDQIVHAVRILRSSIYGFVALERNRGFGLPQDLDISFSSLVTVLIEGLKTHFSMAPKEEML
ncbi:MAG TPA: WHG domain-containing protein [Oligoflexus sp.]|uniref:TetR/AcrR family transcriptional regulator n=1 Tax=Oligoflexus sp. TaxID=1971216 RepID=UPI002D7EBADC|nr:WHG domain-containing protein [Oligoflexus sp.]HET9239138.1 WHG domain-containing protein [Oligoflexus sp.]